jgi:hypothetical protein
MQLYKHATKGLSLVAARGQVLTSALGAKFDPQGESLSLGVNIHHLGVNTLLFGVKLWFGQISIL